MISFRILLPVPSIDTNLQGIQDTQVDRAPRCNLVLYLPYFLTSTHSRTIVHRLRKLSPVVANFK
jgi:hypothetical protein